MFDTIPNLLSTVPTFLFPVFASYKALNTADPALLKPWLMYWVVLACVLAAESWVGFILFWIPFYGWFRLFFLLYLILPQSQGARFLYQEHVEPFLRENELAIDDFISSAHDRVKAAGPVFIKQAIEFIKVNILGLPANEPTLPQAPSTLSYAQNLMARFNLPSARQPTNLPLSGITGTATSTATDFYTLLASAVSAATTSQPTANPDEHLSNSGTLIPPTVHGEERLSFIAMQRQRLSVLLSALDKEASTLQDQATGDTPVSRSSSLNAEAASGLTERRKSTISTRKSEVDFEKIDVESDVGEVENGRRTAMRSQSSGGSWMPWSWGVKVGQDVQVGGQSQSDVGSAHGKDKGKSTGADA